jgi:hypothetical protein
MLYAHRWEIATAGFAAGLFLLGLFIGRWSC